MASSKLLADSPPCISFLPPHPLLSFGPPSHFLSPFPLFVSKLIFHYLWQCANMQFCVSTGPNDKPGIISPTLSYGCIFFLSPFLRSAISEKNAFDLCAGPSWGDPWQEEDCFWPLGVPHPFSFLDGASGSPRPALVASLHSWPALVPLLCHSWKGLWNHLSYAFYFTCGAIEIQKGSGRASVYHNFV